MMDKRERGIGRCYAGSPTCGCWIGSPVPPGYTCDPDGKRREQDRRQRRELTATLDGLLRTIAGGIFYLAMGLLLAWQWAWPAWWLAVGTLLCLVWDVI